MFPKGVHIYASPELDKNTIRELDDHRTYQMMMGMCQWMVTISRPELCQVVSSLNHFGRCTREGYLDLLVGYFGYIQTTVNKQIAIDSRPIQSNRAAPNFTKLILNFLKDYPDAKEEMDVSFPTSFGPVLQHMFLVDFDHAHDLATRKYITGLVGYLGSTPTVWFSHRQRSITSSTYTAEFSALHKATYEIQSLCCMLRCLGCNVSCDCSSPTRIFGDNLSVILNS